MAFVAAESREFAGVLANSERVNKLGWPLPFARKIWLNGRAALLLANGPGPKLAGQALDVLREYRELEGQLEALISTGFCGALHPALKPCDIFVATEVLPGRDHAGGFTQPLAHARGSVRTGQLLSIDRVASTVEEKAELHKTGADAVEMEAAAVVARAREWNIPFYCIRVVTDTAGESFPLDFNRMRDAEGRFSRSKIMAAALLRPTVFPELLKLNNRCKDAAQALGDFIANTRF